MVANFTYTRSPLSTDHMLFLRPILVALQPTFKIFSSPFDVDCEEVPLQLQMELIDLQCSEDFKSKFLACHILNFYKSHVRLFGLFSKLITHTQEVINIFGTKYRCEKLSFKMKHTKSILRSQPSNHLLFDVLILSTSLCNPDIQPFRGQREGLWRHTRGVRTRTITLTFGLIPLGKAWTP